LPLLNDLFYEWFVDIWRWGTFLSTSKTFCFSSGIGFSSGFYFFGIDLGTKHPVVSSSNSYILYIGFLFSKLLFVILFDCCHFSASDLNRELSEDAFYSFKVSNSW